VLLPTLIVCKRFPAQAINLYREIQALRPLQGRSPEFTSRGVDNTSGQWSELFKIRREYDITLWKYQDDTSFNSRNEIGAYLHVLLLATTPSLVTRSSVLEQSPAEGILYWPRSGALMSFVCVRFWSRAFW
jgi:hypothetical protein